MSQVQVISRRSNVYVTSQTSIVQGMFLMTFCCSFLSVMNVSLPDDISDVVFLICYFYICVVLFFLFMPVNFV